MNNFEKSNKCEKPRGPVSVIPCWGPVVPLVEALRSPTSGALRSVPSARLGRSSQSCGPLSPSHLNIIHIIRMAVTENITFSKAYVRFGMDNFYTCISKLHLYFLSQNHWNGFHFLFMICCFEEGCVKWLKILTESRPFIINIRLPRPLLLH